MAACILDSTGSAFKNTCNSRISLGGKKFDYQYIPETVFVVAALLSLSFFLKRFLESS